MTTESRLRGAAQADVAGRRQERLCSCDDAATEAVGQIVEVGDDAIA